MIDARNAVKSLVPRPVKKLFQYGRYAAFERRAMSSADYCSKICGYDRIYHYHVRKTAGTSLNLAFKSAFSSAFLGSPQEEELFKRKWAMIGGKLYVTHNEFLLERGQYFFGDGHAALHEINIPPNTFKITILRDPIKRVVSHYRMIRYWNKNRIAHPARYSEGRYAGSSFSDFINIIPRKHLLRQLYMFSKNFDVGEAAHNLGSMNFIMLTENYANHLNILSSIVGFNLRNVSAKVGYGDVILSEADHVRLAEILEPEYALIKAVSPLFGIHLPDNTRVM